MNRESSFKYIIITVSMYTVKLSNCLILKIFRIQVCFTTRFKMAKCVSSFKS